MEHVILKIGRANCEIICHSDLKVSMDELIESQLKDDSESVLMKRDGEISVISDGDMNRIYIINIDEIEKL